MQMRFGRRFFSRLAEEWRKIPSFDGRCKNGASASTHGRIHHRSSRFSTAGKARADGYLQVSIMRKHYLVHRLIAETFLADEKGRLQQEQPGALIQVDHKDNCKANNRVENLRWLSTGDHAKKTAQLDIPRPRPLMATARGITAVSKEDGTRHTFRSVTLAARHFDLPVKLFRSIIFTTDRFAYRSLAKWTFQLARQETNEEGEAFRSIPFLRDERGKAPMVSNKGRVRHTNGRVTLGCLTSLGYRRIQLQVGPSLMYRLAC